MFHPIYNHKEINENKIKQKRKSTQNTEIKGIESDAVSAVHHAKVDAVVAVGSALEIRSDMQPAAAAEETTSESRTATMEPADIHVEMQDLTAGVDHLPVSVEDCLHDGMIVDSTIDGTDGSKPKEVEVAVNTIVSLGPGFHQLQT
ncbi:hypothetical protein L2E82_11911 [Cichorium intybus]|uniref:Uncharacterized protein n=1 Tax=Cichorium intybus TaxID=13427 RepID=A0ACB9GEH6_CICIN|nr:hypothetical protein L2E82_11911 [Cichorium intybus]